MNKQWVGFANNTKWSELQQIMSAAGSKAPYWRSRAKNGYVYPPIGWDGDWTYHFRLGEYKDMEWCEITPRGHMGTLSLEDIIATCQKIGFETEVSENIVRVIGYRNLAFNSPLHTDPQAGQ
jgi:hypothetical protein